jgi:hypothetical protein
VTLGTDAVCEAFDLPENTKHGAVLPLTRREHDALAARFPDPDRKAAR